MRREAALLYGVTCYGIFFLTFLYMVAFLGNFGVPKTIDSGLQGSPGLSVIVNFALIALFGVQHSVMARPAFKQRLTKIVPKPIERSTYVLASSVALIALFAFWQPLATPLWSLKGGVAYGLSMGLMFVGVGVGVVLYSTFLIDHFDLFGLRQVFLYWRNKPYTEKRFVTPGPYQYIRHPLYVGWLLTVWATPSITAGHFLLAAIMTVYIFTAIVFEEHDLSTFLGRQYKDYRARTPMMIPRLEKPNAPIEIASRHAQSH